MESQLSQLFVRFQGVDSLSEKQLKMKSTLKPFIDTNLQELNGFANCLNRWRLQRLHQEVGDRYIVWRQEFGL